jgi:PAS domain S-box-containing protein
MRLSTRQKINAAIGVALLILGVVSWISYRSTVALVHNSELQLHTHREVQALARLAALLREAESGQRGFLLTGRDGYLEPYEGALREVDGQLRAVRRLAVGNAGRAAQLDRIDRLVEVKLAEMAETIRLRRTRGLDAAVEVVGTDRGRAAMREIRAIVREVEREEQEELARHGHVVQADARRTLRVIPLVGVLALLLAGVSWAGFHRTLSESERAGRALRRSDERFRSLIENASDVIAILDADGVIRYESPALERVLGYRVEEMVGTNAFDSIHEDDQGTVAEKFAHALEAPGRVVSLEYRFRHRDGTWRYLESNGCNLLDHPAVGGIVVNSRDITERKVAEEALAAQARELRRSNQELEQFAYVASHDLQEPLRKIQAFGDRLQGRYAAELGERGADYLQRMQGAAGRMQVLIQDLLSFSRVSTKARPFVPVELATVADEVISDLQARIQATGGRVETEALPTLRADRTQMRQLLQNLVGNALKFHREGVSPVVRIEGRTTGGNGSGAPRGVEIRVADNGIGFDEKYLDRIFDPFQRLHGRSEYEGTGMGLAICRKIAERHGGGITAHSTPGRGTTFIVTLPAAGAGGAA